MKAEAPQRLNSPLRKGLAGLAIASGMLSGCGPQKPPADFSPEKVAAIGSLENQFSKFASDVDEERCTVPGGETVETGFVRPDGTVCKGSISLLGRDGKQYTVNVLRVFESSDKSITLNRVETEIPESRLLIEIQSDEGTLYRPAALFFGSDYTYVDIEASIIMIDPNVTHSFPAIKTTHEGAGIDVSSTTPPQNRPNPTQRRLETVTPFFDAQTQCINFDGHIVKGDGLFRDSQGKVYRAIKTIVREDKNVACEIVDDLGRSRYVIAKVAPEGISVLEIGVGRLDDKGIPQK